MNKLYLDQRNFQGLVLDICRQIERSNWQPEKIIGIGRGGLTAAVMISHWFNLPMVSMDVSLRDHENTESKMWLAEDAANGKNILIVDDINDSGATFAWIKQDWESATRRAIDWHGAVRFASVVFNEASTEPSDFTGLTINKAQEDVWMVFPWENWWNTP